MQFKGCFIIYSGKDKLRVSLTGVLDHRLKWTAAVFLLLTVLAACVSAPVQEMSDARQAIRAAKEASSTPDSESDLAKAESLLKEAESALENGEYKKARITATEARDAAIKAQQPAP